MNSETVMTSLNEVFRDVLDEPDLTLTDSTTAADVEGWDSVTHVMMIVAVEKKFSVKFTTAEIHACATSATLSPSSYGKPVTNQPLELHHIGYLCRSIQRAAP
jgi:acyl carrier protein